MTSLSDVYEGGVGTAAGQQRRLLGAGLFVAGAAMVVGAIPIATTDLAAGFGLGLYEARELAGVLAGLGLPAVFVGIFAVLPAGRATRATAAIGASVAIFGVVVFTTAYPNNWLATAPALAAGTVGLYAAGTLVTFWCLFVGVATFKTRNEPGGSARLELTDEGTVRVVTEESGSVPGFGSVGMFGSDPDGDVSTQTNRGGEEPAPSESRSRRGSSGERRADVGPAGDRPGDVQPAGDGAGGVQPAGESGTDPAAASADLQQAVAERGQPDQYCGNCTHFEYVRADGEITPYCGFYGELLEDMDACDQWTPAGGEGRPGQNPDA